MHGPSFDIVFDHDVSLIWKITKLAMLARNMAIFRSPAKSVPAGTVNPCTSGNVSDFDAMINSDVTSSKVIDISSTFDSLILILVT